MDRRYPLRGFAELSGLVACLCMAMLTGCAPLRTATVPVTATFYKDLSAPEKALLPDALGTTVPPRELQKLTQQEYRISPPDSLVLTSVRVVPKSPYLLQPFDILRIDGAGTFSAEIIQGPYQVGPDGTVVLGGSYGAVNVSGLTVQEAETAIVNRLKRTLASPEVSVALLQTASTLQIDGEHFVSQDGFITLGTFGRVYVTGLTIEQAREKIESHLKQYLEDPMVGVEMLAFNSQRYYIVLQGSSIGDRTLQVPFTGNETVLDAIALIRDVPRISSKRIWIARPSTDAKCDQILPVDWKNVVRNGSHQTNYQLFPNDRVFVSQDRFSVVGETMARITSPLDPALGFGLLSTQAVQSVNRFPNGINLGAGFL